MRFNLWLAGQSPTSGTGSEVVIQSFQYCPLNTYPLGTPSDLPYMKVTATSSAVHPGGRLAIGLTARNPTLPFLADFYLGALVPDGRVCFISSLAPVGATCLPPDSDPRTFPPLAASVLVPSGLDVTLPELFAYTLDGGEPPGDYLFFGLLTPPGAFDNGLVDECKLLFLSTAPSTFSP
jgi:hypothetical protein